jgi:DNA excision repair protein ERCC-4
MNEKESVSVVIDVHEPPEITGVIDAHDEVEDYSFEELPASDIEIEGVGFERKTIEDYTSSLTSGRLTEQVRKLGQRYEHAYILVDGDMSETDSPFRSNIDGKSLRGHMASLTARDNSGVHAVICCSNQTMLADMAVRLTRKHIEDSDESFVPQPVDDPDVSTTTMMFACVDGVGPKMAETLSDEFSSVEDFMDRADFDTLRGIEGVGDKMAARILEAFV